MNKGVFRPRDVYQLHFKHINNDPPSCWLWKSKCNSKHKFFAWLVLHDRVNTKDMLIRRHWNVTNNHDCILCRAGSYEDWRHLFFNCVFSTHIWNYLQIAWHPGNNSESLLMAKRSFKGPCFVEIVILSCWCIWKQRNGWIFKGIAPSFRGWKAIFFQEVTMLKHRVKQSVADSISLWLADLP